MVRMPSASQCLRFWELFCFCISRSLEFVPNRGSRGGEWIDYKLTWGRVLGDRVHFTSAPTSASTSTSESTSNLHRYVSGSSFGSSFQWLADTPLAAVLAAAIAASRPCRPRVLVDGCFAPSLTDRWERWPGLPRAQCMLSSFAAFPHQVFPIHLQSGGHFWLRDVVFLGTRRGTSRHDSCENNWSHKCYLVCDARFVGPATSRFASLASRPCVSGYAQRDETIAIGMLLLKTLKSQLQFGFVMHGSWASRRSVGPPLSSQSSAQDLQQGTHAAFAASGQGPFGFAPFCFWAHAKGRIYLMIGLGVGGLCRHCTGRGLCSRSGEPHVQLQGKVDGKWVGRGVGVACAHWESDRWSGMPVGHHRPSVPGWTGQPPLCRLAPITEPYPRQLARLFAIAFETARMNRQSRVLGTLAGGPP